MVCPKYGTEGKAYSVSVSLSPLTVHSKEDTWVCPNCPDDEQDVASYKPAPGDEQDVHILTLHTCIHIHRTTHGAGFSRHGSHFSTITHNSTLPSPSSFFIPEGQFPNFSLRYFFLIPFMMTDIAVQTTTTLPYLSFVSVSVL